MSSYVNGPRALSALVEKAAAPAARKHGATLTTLARCWPQVAGDDLWRYGAPKAVSFPRGKQGEGVLTVACVDAFKTDFEYRAPVMMERIGLLFGYRAIEQIRLVSGPAPVPPLPVRMIPTPAQAQAAASAVDTVDDPELKAALQRLGEGIIARRTAPAAKATPRPPV